MKTCLKGILMLAVLTLMAFGCDRSDDAGPSSEARHVQRWGDLEAVLQVTDLQGRPKDSFGEGENFMLSFIVKNRGKKDEWIGPWDFPVTITDFFAVYKVTQETDGKYLVGKPFELGGNTRDLLLQVVPAESQLKYVFPWMSQKGQGYIMPTYSKPEKNFNHRSYQAVETHPLSKGKYFSGFTLEHEGRELAFRVEFTIR